VGHVKNASKNKWVLAVAKRSKLTKKKDYILRHSHSLVAGGEGMTLPASPDMADCPARWM